MPRWLVVLGFAVANGLLAFTGAVVYSRVVDGPFATGPVVTGVSVGWVLWLTVGFLMSDRRDQPRAWLGYAGGLCLVVLVGFATWWIASVLEATFAVPTWLAVATGILGLALMFTLPMSLGAWQQRRIPQPHVQAHASRSPETPT